MLEAYLSYTCHNLEKTPNPETRPKDHYLPTCATHSDHLSRPNADEIIICGRRGVPGIDNQSLYKRGDAHLCAHFGEFCGLGFAGFNEIMDANCTGRSRVGLVNH